MFLLVALKKVFQEPVYILLGGGVAATLLFFSLKLAINLSTLSTAYATVIAVLAGINVSLIVYYVRMQKRRLSKAGATASTLGIITGTIGIGCAACGSIILNSIIGTAAGASLIGLLPLRGGEFGIVGIILLGTASYLLAKQITKPYVCDTD